MKQRRKLVYDYYNVSVPAEEGVNDEERANAAINIARDRAYLYVMPCNWRAKKIGDNEFDTMFRVVRIRTNLNYKTKGEI